MIKELLPALSSAKDFLVFMIGYDGVKELIYSTSEAAICISGLMLYLTKFKNKSVKNRSVVNKLDEVLNIYD